MADAEKPAAKKEWFQIRQAKAIEKRSVEWLWKAYIPRGKLTLITGDPQAGKSTFLCELVACLTTGRPMPGEDGPREPENCWIMSSEDDADTTIVWRLENQGADLSRVYITERRAKLEGQGLKELVKAIKALEISVVIVDTLTTWMGADMDMNRANEVMTWLNALQDVAQQTGVTFLLVRHRRKGPANDQKLQAGLGSIGFTASVRSELMATARPDKKKKGNFIRVVERSKGNIGRPPPKLRYDIIGGDDEVNPHGVFEWVGEYDGPTGDEPDADGAAQRTGPRVPKKLGAARQFLRDVLKDGAKPVTELLKMAEELRITERTLRRAKDGIAESLQTSDGNWVWYLIPTDPSLQGPGVQTCHEMKS